MSSESEDFFGNRYYVYNRRFLSIVGLWPYQKTSKRLCYACFIMLTVTMSMVVQTYILVVAKSDAKRIAELMQTLLPTVTFSCCYFNVMIRISQMRKILDHIRSDWNKLSNAEELMVMHKYTDASSICCRLIICVFYIYISILLYPTVSCFFLYTFGAIDNSQLILPVYDDIFVTSDIRYFAMAPLQVTLIFIITTVGIAFYTTFVLVAQHACLLFNVLTIKLGQPFSKDICKLSAASNDIKSGNEFRWIVSIIKYHDEVVKFSTYLKLLCGESYIIQVFMTLLFIILDFFYVFQILDMTITTGEAIRNSIFIVGNLLMIYAAFFLGQRLINHSVNVYTECCLVPFYELSLESNKLLLLLTTRCMTPCYLSIGRFLIASHELFIKVMKTALSCASVFYNTRRTVT